MKDFDVLIDKALAVCDSINEELGYIAIDYDRDIYWEIATNFTHSWGVTIYEDDMHTIKISSVLLEDDVPDNSTISTMIHEILHTCPGGFSHKGEWKKLAELVNHYTEYTIKRTTSATDKGVVKRKKAKYTFRCKNCGQIINRYCTCKFTKNYQNYRCGICKGSFENITDSLKE